MSYAIKKNGMGWRAIGGRGDVGEDEVFSQGEPAPIAQNPINAFSIAIQQRLDDFARTRNYDGILSAASYSASGIQRFASDGQYAASARDATWSVSYDILADVESGIRPAPTIGELLAELPALAWPD